MKEPLGYEITKVGRYTYEARELPMASTNDVEAVAGAMLRLRDTLNPMTDLMVGYRKNLLDAGFSARRPRVKALPPFGPFGGGPAFPAPRARRTGEANACKARRIQDRQ